MKRLLVAPALLLLSAVPASAQDRPALPDIAPREVEIRGRLDPSLPTLQRQPLTGFDVPPVMYEISGREPYAESYAEAELEQNPLRRPDLPEVTTLAGAPPIRGEFEASAGLYLSRIVRGHAALPISQQASISGRLRYEGSDGFSPESAEPGASSAFNDLDGGLTLQALLGTVAIGGDLNGMVNRYTAYGASPVPERSLRSGGGSLWLRSHGRTRTDFQARLLLEAGELETNRTQGGFTDGASRTEQRIALVSSLQTPLPGGDLLGHVEAGGSTLDSGVGNEGVNHFEAGGGYRFLYRRRFSVTLGGAVMGYGVRYGSSGQRPDSSSGVYLSPAVAIELSPATGVRVYAHNQPGIDAHTLTALADANPFLVPEPQIEPTVRTIDAEAGASIFLGRLQLTGRTGYRSMPYFLFFEQASPAEGGQFARLIAARYAEASVRYVGGDASLVMPGGLQMTVGGSLRDGALERPGADTDIPYFGPMVGYATLSLPFSERRGLLQLVGTYESARDVDRSPDPKRVGDYFDLDAALSFEFTPSLGVIARVQNISADYRERWDWYPQTPLTVLAGVQVEW